MFMKREKYHLLFQIIICTLLTFAACTSGDSPDDVSPQQPGSMENPYVIEKEKVISETNSFLNRISNKTSLRSASVEERDYSIHTSDYAVSVTNSSGRGTVTQRIPVHIINYKDTERQSAGFAITVGDRRFTDKVIAFSESGSLDLLTDTSADFWDDLIQGYIHKIINSENTRRQISSQTVIAAIEPDTAQTDAWYYHTLACHTNWHQTGEPYTGYTPFRDGKRASAGCVAVAMGQIMAYHEWPLRGAFERYSDEGVLKMTATQYNPNIWALINSPLPAADSTVREHVANLLAEIGYKLNTKYDSNTSASAYPDDAPTVFYQMGYYCKSLARYDFTKLITDLDNGQPVFMSGWKSAIQGGAGHAFVVHGAVTRGNLQEDLGIPAYLIIKNGNGGEGDRWILEEIFRINTNTNRGDRNENEQDDDEENYPESELYPYRYMCRMVTGITPSATNTGSLTIFKVKRKNPY
jgi:hypothetical protein